MSMTSVEVGKTYQVMGFCYAHEKAKNARLRAMGFTKGVKVTILKKAPLGCPFLLSVRGAKVALREDEIKLLSLELR